ncbi:cupin domain-containing protein [Silanimonas sp.]|uniref:cupin domain-containing protein n=1 Tax=Silanimonas sp. TaxID=1929290 RepID=UPI0022CA2244|nr:cupin domain-containing protein [Silanimonas sp.]MCZ8113732.1 cupin domain-containing protein [Silanimonas sp.]
MNRKTSAPSKTLPIEIDATGKGPLGMPADVFLRDYWQKRPLLIRNAFPGFETPISPDDLGALSLEATALSRLIVWDRKKDKWAVETGPLPEDRFDRVPERDWTLLVQDVDKWDADVRELVEAFPFLPRWRIDDVMISFAVEGGSVGAHIDQYDVFLLQGMGHRHWQIDANPNQPVDFRNDAPIRLLKSFTPSHEWTLGPGDMLYLPPGLGHHGVALDPCLTFSLGMRAPAKAELIEDFALELASRAGERERYADPDLAVPTDAFEIDAAALDRVKQTLGGMAGDGAEDEAVLRRWFGRFITRYRASGNLQPPKKASTRAEFDAAIAAGGVVQRHPFSRVAWLREGKSKAMWFVTGSDIEGLRAKDAALLCREDTLNGAAWGLLDEHAREAVVALAALGHYRAIAPKKPRSPRKPR